MQKITPFLWFDKEAVEAANFYASVFPNARVTHTEKLKGTPSGDCDLVSFEVMGYGFQAISAGPLFQKNPSISFMVNFDPSQDKDAKSRIDPIWERLAEGGKIMMPLDTYPFSERYGWIQDKYGVSWQLILTNPEGEPRPTIIPSLMFTGDITGKADEAIDFYVSVFRNSKRGMSAPYPPGAAPEKAAKLMFAEFMLEKQWFTAMDSGHMHTFGFNEGISLLVSSDTQEEIDYYWGKLSAHKESEQCGWLKDKYGVSWQIIPTAMDKLFSDADPVKAQKAMQAMLQMKKIDIAGLQKAADSAG